MSTRVYSVNRSEERIPLEVLVQIAGNADAPGVETTFTENVSPRGARVISLRRWHTNERLTLSRTAGQFRAVTRVTYCQPLRGEGFAIGLEILEPTGTWVIDVAAA